MMNAAPCQFMDKNELRASKLISQLELVEYRVQMLIDKGPELLGKEWTDITISEVRTAKIIALQVRNNIWPDLPQGYE